MAIIAKLMRLPKEIINESVSKGIAIGEGEAERARFSH